MSRDDRKRDDEARAEELLEGLVTGDIAPDDERVREMLERSDDFRIEWESLERVRSGLSEEDAERDEILGEIAAGPLPPVDPRLTTAFREIAERGPTRDEGDPESHDEAPPVRDDRSMDRPRSSGTPIAKPRARGRTWFVLAAAAMVVAIIWTPWGEVREWIAPPGDQRLNSADDLEVRGLEPSGAVESYGTFRWSAIEGQGVTAYRVTVFDRSRREIRSSPRLSEPGYEVPGELPSRIVWRVTALDAIGGIVAVGESEAWLKDP